MDRLSYVFNDDAVHAVDGGRIVASALSMEELAIKLAFDPHGDPNQLALPTNPHGELAPSITECPECHTPVDPANAKFGFDQCPNCGWTTGANRLPQAEHHALPPMPSDPTEGGHFAKAATHIVTPNGLKGKIMGRVASVWGDQVTVRFENGHIATLHVSDDLQMVNEKTASGDRLSQLREKLAEQTPGDKGSLRAREVELKQVVEIATEMASRRNASDSEVAEYDGIRAEASYEISEVHDALRHLADAIPFAPPAPFEMHVAVQESIGRHDGSWLDEVAQDMIREAEAIDFDKLLNEGPEVFVTDMETAPLGDQGVTRQLAASFIRTKTAAAAPELREKYETMWLERVESARRAELASRKETMKREASTESEDFDGPAEGLFF